MKKLITIAFILISIISFAQTQGTTEFNNIKINGEIKTNTITPNVIPDHVITQDTTNKITTYSNVLDASVIPVISLIDTIPLYLLDSIQTNKIISNSELSLNIGTVNAMKLYTDSVKTDSLFIAKSGIKIGDSIGIAISSNNDTLATMPSMRAYVDANSLSITGNDGELLMSNGTGGTKTNTNLLFNGTNLIAKDAFSNYFYGFNSGNSSITGAYQNVAFGENTGHALTLGDGNVFLGYYAGTLTTTGTSNVFIGNSAGENNITGSNNVFIGNLSGYNTNSSDSLIIANSATNKLITGDFSTKNVSIHDTLNVPVIKGVIQVAKSEVLYTNTTQTTIITLPTGSIIWDVAVNVKTAFNDSGTDNLYIGITGDNDLYLNAITDYGDVGALETIEFYTSEKYGFRAIFPNELSSQTNITYQYAGQNSDATQGQAFVYVYYSVF